MDGLRARTSIGDGRPMGPARDPATTPGVPRGARARPADRMTPALSTRAPVLPGVSTPKAYTARKRTVARPRALLRVDAMRLEEPPHALPWEAGPDGIAPAPLAEQDGIARELVLQALRARHATLSGRERDVMRLAARGLLNKQIAATLGVAERTVKAHRARVAAKMGATSLPHLVRMAERLGLCGAFVLEPLMRAP